MWLERLVPPPVCAFPGRSAVGRDIGWPRRWRAGQRSAAQCAATVIGHDELVSGTADGDAAPVMQAVMIRAHQHQVVEFGGTAVFPVPDVMGM